MNAPLASPTRSTIDHSTQCNFDWCVLHGHPDEHGTLCDPYIPATMSLERPSDRGATFPVVGFGVVWDRSQERDRAPSIAMHLLGPDQDADAEFTLAEALRLRAALERAISVVAGIVLLDGAS